jgi:hypothetical protein
MRKTKLLFRYLPIAQVAETDPKQINQVKYIFGLNHQISSLFYFLESNTNDFTRIIQSINWRTRYTKG